MNYEEADKLKIFKCISGSHAYGTALPEIDGVPQSDFDYRGIFISPAYYMLGLDNVEQVENTGDDTLFEIRKYIKLCADCNPNILELLFVDEQHILFHNKYYDKLRDNRQLFLSKRARHTFSGYAIAQAHRIENHRGYLLDPPNHKPTREEFNLTNETLISDEHRSALASVPDKYVKEEFKEYVIREKKYQKALAHWNSYSQWEKSRNKKRRELEYKYGFDTKHASHLVRLINMGEEILSKGTLTVYRPEREELKAIRNGAWSYQKVKEYADGVDTKFALLEADSKLPYSSDKVKIRELLISILEENYGISFKS